MRIVFANPELRDECNNHDLLIKRHGIHRAKLLRQRLDELFNAEVLADMRAMPHLIFHQDAGPAVLALDVGYPYRLIFKPGGPPDLHGGWDWKKVDSIIILDFIGPK